MEALTDEERRAIEKDLDQYPVKRGACIEALALVQRRCGWISDESLAAIAELLEMSLDELDSVATFYNLIYRRPVGRHVILLCDSVSCCVMGFERIRAALEARLGIRWGETTKDDRFTLLPMACLGICDHAPALMIDEDTHVDLDPEGLDDILGRYA